MEYKTNGFFLRNFYGCSGLMTTISPTYSGIYNVKEYT